MYRKAKTTQRHPAHHVSLYLLWNLAIIRAKQVGAMDIINIPLAKGFVYLVAVVDWSTRRLLTWRLSITMDIQFCLEAAEAAVELYGKPDILNTDQGSQFMSHGFTGFLKDHGIGLSLDGRGAWHDNILVERLWRGVKYEEVYLQA